MLKKSKPLGTGDHSGDAFVRELLDGDPTFGVNFDRVQWDRKRGKWVVIELLLCEEAQPTVTPHTSHPNNYFEMNSQKFLRLWRLSQDLNAELFLVNYAKPGTRHEDQVRVMQVLDVDPDAPKRSWVSTKDWITTRAQFKAWFRELNWRGDTSPSPLPEQTRQRVA